MSDSLKEKTIKGVVWSGLERFSTAGVNFIIGLIIARILSPDEYGIIAMLAIFMAISQSIIDSGFSNALIRKNDRKEIDFSTTLYFNVVISTLIYGILYLISPFIASFYGIQELESIIKVVGTTLIWGALTIVQQSILTINVDFKTQMIVSLFAAILSGIIGIIMAMSGYGVWALVGQMVTVSIFRTIALWLVAKWRPITGFSKESFKNLFGYGSKILMAGILETIYRNLYSIIIGKYYQANALGLYHRGEQFASYAASNITGVIQRVTFPVMSSLQDDTEMLNKAFIKTLRTTCFFVFPIMTYLFMVSEPLVKLILTDKWIGCVPIIQILCISYMWYPVHILNLNILQVSGRSDLFFKIEVIKKIIGLAILFGSLPFGIIIMCWGRVLYCGLELFINMYYTNHIVKTSCIQQLRHTIPFLLYCIVITIAAALFQPYISSDILKLFINFIFIVLVWLLVVQRIENLYIRDFLLILNRK